MDLSGGLHTTQATGFSTSGQPTIRIRRITGQSWLERALFFCDHHSAMGQFLSAQMTETKLIRKLAPKHFFYVKN